MSVTDAIDTCDKLEFNDRRSFAVVSVLIPNSIQQKTIMKLYTVILDTISNEILRNKFKKRTTTNIEYTFVVNKNNPLRNDTILPSSSIVQPNPQRKSDWMILLTSEMGHNVLELELDSTIILV